MSCMERSEALLRPDVNVPDMHPNRFEWVNMTYEYLSTKFFLAIAIWQCLTAKAVRTTSAQGL